MGPHRYLALSGLLGSEALTSVEFDRDGVEHTFRLPGGGGVRHRGTYRAYREVGVDLEFAAPGLAGSHAHLRGDTLLWWDAPPTVLLRGR